MLVFEGKLPIKTWRRWEVKYSTQMHWPSSKEQDKEVPLRGLYTEPLFGFPRGVSTHMFFCMTTSAKLDVTISVSNAGAETTTPTFQQLSFVCLLQYIFSRRTESAIQRSFRNPSLITTNRPTQPCRGTRPLVWEILRKKCVTLSH